MAIQKPIYLFPMAKKIEKYFIALVPKGDIQAEATGIKSEMQRLFNLKYALKSPAHVTLKMPFSWNENKEDDLIHRLEGFFRNFSPFDLKLKGFDRFGMRVIFIKVLDSPPLFVLQKELSRFCKTKLNQITELSDFSYTPHMTISFKDIKKNRFQEYWDYIQSLHIQKSWRIEHVALLKKVEGKWKVIHEFDLI
jgi:2'-5' RNA ligase